MNYGIRHGGGIGEVMMALVVDDIGNSRFFEWTSFMTLFFLSVNVIGLNVLFGIIVDTFSFLRSKSQQREDDLKDICFVCGINRSEFSKFNVDFEKHIFNKHDVWKYIYFLYFIMEKGEDELDGLENYAWNNYMKIKTNWLPIGRTKYLGISLEIFCDKK